MSGSQDVQLKILASGTHCFKHVTESINTILITWSCKTNIVELPGFTVMVLFDCKTLFTQPPPSMSLGGILGLSGLREEQGQNWTSEDGKIQDRYCEQKEWKEPG